MDHIINRLVQSAHNNNSWYFPVEQQEVSVKCIDEDAKKYACKLQSYGFKPGQFIGFICNTSSEFIKLLYACWYAGLIPVPLRIQPGRQMDYSDYISACHSVCGFAGIIHDDNISIRGLKSVDQTKHGQDYLIFSISDIKNKLITMDCSSALIRPEDIALIQFSSGSTGMPKGVIVTHQMLMAQLQNLQELFITPTGGRSVKAYATWAPLNHDMGMFIGVLSPVYQAVDNILAPPSYYMRNPVRWFQLMAKRNVEIALFTNSALASGLTVIERSKVKIPDLSFLNIYIAAEKVSAIVLRKAINCLSKYGISSEQFYVGYGMAENGLGATTTALGDVSTLRVKIADYKIIIKDAYEEDTIELVSIGVPYSHHEVTVRDGMDNILPELQLGEINIKSHCVTPGYYENAEKTQEVICDDGRLRTGDLGFHYNNEFYFYSRKDDLIILGGRNIVPDDIELTVEQLAEIRSGSSVLLASEDTVTGVICLTLLVEQVGVKSTEDLTRLRKDIQKLLFDQYELLLNKILFVEKGSVEKTSSGKKRRKVIRQRLVRDEIIQCHGKTVNNKVETAA